MKKKEAIINSLAVFAAALILTGCGSQRFATTLKPDPGMRDLSFADNVKFTIVQLNVTGDEVIKEIKAPDLQAHAADVSPRLFGNDFADLPVSLDVDCKGSDSDLGIVLTLLTAFTIPFPYGDDIECKAHTLVGDESGYVVDGTDSFILTVRAWMSPFTPLGLLPVPGRSDLPREYYFDGNDYKPTKRKHLAMDSLTEAVARGIRLSDPARLKAASKSRKARLRQVDLNGQVFWSFMGFSYSDADHKGQRDVAWFNLYREYPTWGAKPVEQVVVARLEDGKWQPMTGYLRSVKQMTTACVLLVDGIPSRVVLREVTEPPLEDFIELPRKCSFDYIRWNNGVLIEVKNSTLPRLMREANPEHLGELVTRIEKEVLILSGKAQTADNRVQEMVVKGEGNPERDRELSVLCRQRIAIFKAILAGLKQAKAARGLQ